MKKKPKSKAKKQQLKKTKKAKLRAKLRRKRTVIGPKVSIVQNGETIGEQGHEAQPQEIQDPAGLDRDEEAASEEADL